MTRIEGALLLQRSVRSDLLKENDQARLEQFADMLGGLPLAISQAAAYLREESVSLNEFTTLYKDIETHTEIFQEAAFSANDEQKSVLYTWEISYKRIAGNQLPQTKSHSALLLDLLGFLDAPSGETRNLSEIEHYLLQEPADRSLLDDFTKKVLASQNTPSELLSKIYKDKFEPPTTFNSALGRLQNYSLVISNECWVHPVVHSWISRRLPVKERCRYLAWAIERILKELNDWDEDPCVWVSTMVEFVLSTSVLHALRQAKMVLNHSLRLETAKHASNDDLLISRIVRLVVRTAGYYCLSGNTREAIRICQQALGIAPFFQLSEEHYHSLRLSLCKARSKTLTPQEAVAEARQTLLSSPSSLKTEVEQWLSDCLYNEGSSEEVVIDAEAIELEEGMKDMKLKVLEKLRGAEILTRKSDKLSKIRTRQLFDKIIIFLRRLPSHQIPHDFFFQILYKHLDLAETPSDQRLIRDIIEDHEDVYDETTLKMAENGIEAIKAIATSSVAKENAYRYQMPSLHEILLRLIANVNSRLERGEQMITGMFPGLVLPYLYDLKLWLEWGRLVNLALHWLGYFESKTLPDIAVLRHELSPSDFKELIEDPLKEWAEVYQYLGKALREMGRHQAAEEAYANSFAIYMFALRGAVDMIYLAQNVYDLANSICAQGEERTADGHAFMHRYYLYTAAFQSMGKDPRRWSNTRGRKRKRILNEDFGDE